MAAAGIMPDVFVPIDTTQSSNYFGQLVRKGMLNTFALAQVDETAAVSCWRPTRARKLSAQQFTVDDALDWPNLVTYAAKEGVETDADGLATFDKNSSPCD